MIWAGAFGGIMYRLNPARERQLIFLPLFHPLTYIFFIYFLPIMLISPILHAKSIVGNYIGIISSF